MPDEQGNTAADSETVEGTSLHAYKEGRDEDVKGDVEKLQSNKPEDQQQDTLEGSDELQTPHEKH